MHQKLSDYIRKRITIDDNQLKTVLSFYKPLNLTKNEIVVNEGDVSHRMFYVSKGCLRVFFINEEGHEATRYLAFEGNFATGLVSFISEKPSLEFIQAIEETEILFITKNDFYHLLEIIPGWEKFYRHYLEHAYITNTNRLMSFITMNASERYSQLLSQNPMVVQRLSNKIVASYLNVSQETLSRLKSKI